MLKEAAASSQLCWSQIWAANRAQPQHCSNASDRGRWCWLWEASCCCLSCWHWLPPCCPWSSSSTSPSLCSSFFMLQAPVSTHTLTTRTLQAAHQGITPFPTVAPVEMPVLRINMMDCGWQGSLMTALGVCLVWIELFQLSRNATKLSFSHLWKNVQCSWSHLVFAGVWQKMSSTLCYWDTCGHLFCIAMERAFLVSRMLAAVTSNPESGLFEV